MNILVITRDSLTGNNNTGNTIINIFQSFTRDCNIYNLYCRANPPENTICKSVYQISEMNLVKNLFKRTPVGKEINQKDFSINTTERFQENNLYNNAKKIDFKILWFVRELIWTFGNWKNDNLLKYILKIKPDIVFMPVFGCYYPHKILNFIAKNVETKIVLFHADDNYTLKQYAISPIYWIYRLGLRKWVRKSVKISDSNYAISEIQKKEYEKCFKKKFSILTKGADFSKQPSLKDKLNSPLKLVYTGNISSGRWKSLVLIGRALDRVNKDIVKGNLIIYSHTPITKKISRAFNKINSIHLMGGVSIDKIPNIQRDADILVHVESMQLKERLQVHQSFSTKIVDYFISSRCIFAVGTLDEASIDYLKNNNAGIIATNEKNIEKNIRILIDNPKLILDYGQKAWECGKRNHQMNVIKNNLYNSFTNLLKE